MQVRISGQDEGVDPEFAIGIQLRKYLVGISNDSCAAARPGPADAGPEIVLDIPLCPRSLAQLSLATHAIGGTVQRSAPDPGALFIIKPAEQPVGGDASFGLALAYDDMDTITELQGPTPASGPRRKIRDNLAYDLDPVRPHQVDVGGFCSRLARVVRQSAEVEGRPPA